MERLRLFIQKGIPENVRMFIEAKVKLAGEFPDLLTGYISGQGKISFAKKRRPKKMKVFHKCARWNCNIYYRSLGFISVNCEDKINFIKDGLSRGYLDDMPSTLEIHPSRDVHITIHS